MGPRPFSRKTPRFVPLKATVEGFPSLTSSTTKPHEHLDAVKRKLGAANRTEAVAIALKKHLLKI